MIKDALERVERVRNALMEIDKKDLEGVEYYVEELNQAHHSLTIAIDEMELRNRLIWDRLIEHEGHEVMILSRGTDDLIHNVSLECADCWSVILDADNPKLKIKEGK